MNEKKCKALRRIARTDMAEHPVVAYEEQEFNVHKSKNLLGEEVFYRTTKPIRLAVCQRRYYKYLKNQIKSLSKQGKVISVAA